MQQSFHQQVNCHFDTKQYINHAKMSSTFSSFMLIFHTRGGMLFCIVSLISFRIVGLIVFHFFLDIENSFYGSTEERFIH